MTDTDVLVEVDRFEFRDAKPLDIADWPESLKQPDESKTSGTEHVRIVGLRFGRMGRVFDYLCEDPEVVFGAQVVAELPEKGAMVGEVVKPPMSFDPQGLRLNMRKVLRRASPDDLEKHTRNMKLEEQDTQIAKSLVDRYQLPMHILRAESNLDRSKVMIYFASENRVDFRQLLKDLVREIHTRVELRQVGARDQAKDRGGIGPCGEETCCSRFLTKFSAVSVKMARDQGLSLNPTKVSGNCGRLKCCLAYEHPIYQANLKTLPKKGKCVKCKSSGQCGVVRDVDVLKGEVTVRLDDGSSAVFPAADVIADTNRNRHRNEKVVATTDTEALVRAIDEAKEEDS